MSEPKQVQRDTISLHLVVLRCQAGDEQAFASLLETFGERTLRYLRGLVGDDADDVQQEVWLTVYRSVSALSNPGAFRTWLFQTTRHRALDYLRRRKRERELLEDVASEISVAEAAESEASFGALDETSLERALMAIPPPQREVVLLRYRDDLSYQEIAMIVGIPLGTVRTRLHHAKRRLEELLTRGET